MSQLAPPALTFRNIIGQTKAKDLLTRAMAGGKISHAYLFRGPAGVGKRSLAQAFAAYLNCLNPHEHDSCGACRPCRKLASGNHPDLLMIEPEGAAIKIDQIRNLIKDLRFAPLEAQYRVAVLTAVHTMRREAANSLLKTLEEPPANTLLVLTADSAGDLLPTIRSRCQTIPFFPLPYAEVSRYLLACGRATTAAPLTLEQADTLAAIAEGSLGRAVLLRDKEILALRQEIVTSLLPLSPGQPESVTTVFALAEQAAKLEESLPELLMLLKIWFRDLILLGHGAPEANLISRDLAPWLDMAWQRFSFDQLREKISLLDQAEKQLKRNCNRGPVCEVLFFGLL